MITEIMHCFGDQLRPLCFSWALKIARVQDPGWLVSSEASCYLASALDVFFGLVLMDRASIQ